MNWAPRMWAVSYSFFSPTCSKTSEPSLRCFASQSVETIIESRALSLSLFADSLRADSGGELNTNKKTINTTKLVFMVISLDDLGFYVAYDSPQARNSPVLLSDMKVFGR